MGRIENVHTHQEEIDHLRKQVQELSWDTAFEMWTRPAVLNLCNQIDDGMRMVVFLDLDDIGSLNLSFGYSEVDRRVRSLFSEIHNKNVIIGRWYSGDEIILVFEDEVSAQEGLSNLYNKALECGVGFTAASARWEIGQKTIHAVMDQLSMEACSIKKTRHFNRGE